MNGGQVMVVMIVLIVMIAGIVKSRHKSARDAEGTSLMNDPEAARLRGEVQQMKERIQVLERVITDNHKSVDLDREIERLRDR
ncbi:hypothetical protein IFR23_09995 [Sphingomonas sp. CFBP 13603]|uniref:hypothetical protein n=1 Tax=Sphingomonas sp. CFBP 13603 TaxID=2774040 RepID=UPI001865CEB7|nr:hypothetical protein [Sphingomonas sp. CFBP 13603]MBE2992346.1 hypothetical protein [Sphingomonas sp. CFBP 13603]